MPETAGLFPSEITVIDAVKSYRSLVVNEPRWGAGDNLELASTHAYFGAVDRGEITDIPKERTRAVVIISDLAGKLIRLNQCEGE